MTVLVLLIGCSVGTVTTKDPVAPELVPERTRPAHVLFHSDKDFSAVESQQLLLAAEVWSLQTGGLARIELVFDADFTNDAWMDLASAGNWNMLVRMTSDMALIAKMDANQEGSILGLVSPSGGIHNPWRKPLVMMMVADRLDSRDSWRSVALHEFGHALGLPHVMNVSALMFPSYIPHEFACLKKPDLAAFCEVNECGSVSMYPCE